MRAWWSCAQASPYLNPISEEHKKNGLFQDHLRNRAPSPMLQSAMKRGAYADDIDEGVYLGVAIFTLGLPVI